MTTATIFCVFTPDAATTPAQRAFAASGAGVGHARPLTERQAAELAVRKAGPACHHDAALAMEVLDTMRRGPVHLAGAFWTVPAPAAPAAGTPY